MTNGRVARGALPAAAAGQEEADEEVMLGMGIVGFDREHGNLGRRRVKPLVVSGIV
jgi:hypothetical protein